jgi:hypothetical protein
VQADIMGVGQLAERDNVVLVPVGEIDGGSD